MLQHLKIFLRKPLPEKRLLLSVAMNLTFIRVFNAALPFRMLSSMLQSDLIESQDLKNQHREKAEIITGYIENVSKVLPWTSSCLVQAAAAKRMLNQRNIPSSISFGVKKNGGDIQQLNAHAWLIVYGETLLGGKSADQFTPVSSLS